MKIERLVSGEYDIDIGPVSRVCDICVEWLVKIQKRVTQEFVINSERWGSRVCICI